jgi:hypothetical protein
VISWMRFMLLENIKGFLPLWYALIFYLLILATCFLLPIGIIYSTYIGDMFVLCTQRIKDCCGGKQKRYLLINTYISFVVDCLDI